MSREDDGSCKLTSIYKHKERKPKKPHYIPRPWGKPYNYKCFQCPFTCMEKSHLYNHMKYSLCKNSLSLLIESDWPYKKGNLLHPEFHLLHTTEALRRRGQHSEELDTDNSDAGLSKSPPNRDMGQGDKSAVMTTDGSQEDLRQEDEEEEDNDDDEEEDVRMMKEMDQRQKKEELRGAGSQGTPVEPNVSTMLLGLKNKRGKPYKDGEPDFIITDVYSLKNQVTRGKEATLDEPEIKSKHCKMPTKRQGSEDILMEQWKLLSSGQKMGTEEVTPQCTEANSIPCYPPPAYSDYNEPQGVNLSLLGINYPISPNLFSYFGPTMANSVTSHPHLTQLPFLASTAQLIHPPSTHFQPIRSQERSTFLPRFYYPLLFEHSFGTSEGKMAAGKAEAQQQSGSSAVAPLQVKPPSEAQKDGLRKIPTVNTSIPWPTSLRERPLPPDLPCKTSMVHEEEEKWSGEGNKINQAINTLHQKAPSMVFRTTMLGSKEGVNLPHSLRKPEVTMAACLESTGHSVGSLKRKSSCGSGTDFLKDLSGAETLGSGKFNYQYNCVRAATQPPSSLDHHWPPEYNPPSEKTSCSEALTSRVIPASQAERKRRHMQEGTANPADVEVATLLIGDLSKTLEEYQEVEKKLSDLAKKDNPGQKELREQLVKIRRELYHIHQTLKKTPKPHEGPLDLSVKRSSDGHEKGQHSRKEFCRDPLGGSLSLQCKEHLPHRRPLSPIEDRVDQGKPFSPTNEEHQTIDLMIKMSRSESLQPTSAMHLGPAIKAEALPPDLHHVMEPYYSRTTKCEADSSVLLSTDGRSVHATPGPQQPPVHEEGPLGGRSSQRSQSCIGLGETEIIHLHSPLTTD